jgi:hypothetical protein
MRFMKHVKKLKWTDRQNRFHAVRWVRLYTIPVNRNLKKRALQFIKLR